MGREVGLPGPYQPLLANQIDRATSPILKGLRHSAQRRTASPLRSRRSNAGKTPVNPLQP
jgi:hypothetical protein